jgi:hypothetical protein
LTVPRSVEPDTCSARVYQAFADTVTEALANVVDAPPTSFFNSTVLLLRKAR